MLAPNNDNGYNIECKVTPTENGWHVVGNFYADLAISDQDNELDQIETQIDQIGSRSNETSAEPPSKPPTNETHNWSKKYNQP